MLQSQHISVIKISLALSSYFESLITPLKFFLLRLLWHHSFLSFLLHLSWLFLSLHHWWLQQNPIPQPIIFKVCPLSSSILSSRWSHLHSNRSLAICIYLYVQSSKLIHFISSKAHMPDIISSSSFFIAPYSTPIPLFCHSFQPKSG